MLAIQKAHFIGVSMGGMISQFVAIEYLERILILTSMMSLGNNLDSDLPRKDPKLLAKMISAFIKPGFFGSKKGKIKLKLVHNKILMGKANGDIAVKPVAEAAIFNLEKRKGYNFMTGRHYQKAITISPLRYDGLSKMSLPVLSVHGEQDPVIPIAHGKKIAWIIPIADSFWLTNMGHDLPDALIDTVAKKIIKNF